MEPAVPFAALAATALLAVAAWTGLAAAAVALRGLRAPALLTAAGALLLAGVEVRTAVGFGDAGSDVLAVLRGAGALLLTGGLALGALGPALPLPAARLGQAPGVVVPLAAAPRPALLAGLAGLAAAGTALRSRRDAAGAALAAGLLLAAAAAAAAPYADDGPGRALAVVAVRASAALVLLAGLGLLTRASLLAKVVATTVAGVLAMAVAAVGVVGTLVVSSYDRQAEDVVTATAGARAQALADLPGPLGLPTRLVQQACDAGASRCADALALLRAEAFAVRVPAAGAPRLLGRTDPGYSPAELLGIAALPQVRALLEVGRGDPDPLSALVRLTGGRPRLAAVGILPDGRDDPDEPFARVTVYVQPVTDAVFQRSRQDEQDDVALLAGSPLEVAASDDDAAAARALRDAARVVLLDRALGDGITRVAAGRDPTLHLQPVTSGGLQVGVLAVARSSDQALRSQRQALSLLLLAAVATTALVALLALVLGRRTVDPVRRLTAAAERLGRGDLDLSAAAAVRSRDEVGVLSRTFDTMTGSLARLTGDLRSSAARLETVLASMSDGLLATDATGTVTAVNRAALAMLALPAEAVVGRRLVDVADVRGEDGERLADPGLRVQDVPGEVHRVDGEPVPVRVAVTGLRDGDGAVVVLRDTTREREVERMKTEFLSNVSHELRTPLTPIRGYADILASRPGLDPDKVTRFAGTILAESLKMNRVVDLLVDVASLEAGRVVLRPVDVDVRDLLDARVEAWRAKAPERAADLGRRAAVGLPSVHVDPEWLGKALDELVDNALKYTSPGTPVTLSAACAPESDRVRVAVRDAGPGIDDADQALLFTSFEQVDGSATRRVGGLGLGLSFVRRVADDNDFPLTVTSRLGVGSEFALDLPAGAVLPSPRPARAAARVSRASRAARP